MKHITTICIGDCNNNNNIIIIIIIIIIGLQSHITVHKQGAMCKQNRTLMLKEKIIITFPISGIYLYVMSTH